MNKNNAAQFLPLVQALADGKILQYAPDGSTWSDAKSPAFINQPEKYRIKPEPREFWIWRDGPQDMFQGSEDDPDLNWKELIRVREILD